MEEVALLVMRTEAVVMDLVHLILVEALVADKVILVAMRMESVTLGLVHLLPTEALVAEEAALVAMRMETVTLALVHLLPTEVPVAGEVMRTERVALGLVHLLPTEAGEEIRPAMQTKSLGQNPVVLNLAAEEQVEDLGQGEILVVSGAVEIPAVRDCPDLVPEDLTQIVLVAVETLAVRDCPDLVSEDQFLGFRLE